MLPQSHSSAPLRLSPLPRPGNPQIERRRCRPQDSIAAITSAFDHAVQRAGLDLVLVADEFGMVVTNSTTSLDLKLLAAVTPIVGRGHAGARVSRGGQPRDFSVRKTRVANEDFYVIAVGSSSNEAREHELSTCITALKRIFSLN